MLRGSKALVTGASRGIGFAIASMLMEQGCDVIITGRNEKKLQEATTKMPGQVQTLVWDASDIRSAGEKVERAAQMLGGLDIVVNNAGVISQRGEWDETSLLKTTPEEWERVMAVNASGLFFTMQAGVKYMIKNGIRGNILNVTSVAGEEPVFGAYGASKIAATGLTRGWGKMFAKEGIVINGIAPGPVATEMNNWHEGCPMEHSRIPFGRFATIEEIGSLAKYLLSKEAEMVCGEVVILDGAYAIR